MPDVPAVRKIDSIRDVPYRIGYSFRNPVQVKPVTHTRERPFFAMDWAVKGPSQVKEELYKKGVLQRYPTIWRRAAKGMAVSGLGVVGNRKELPNFQELGQAPGPTDNATTTSDTTRSVFGFLDNMITAAGGLITQSQQLEIAKAQAQARPTSLPLFYTPGQGASGIGVLGWTAIIGIVGAGAYYFLKR
jgi:hypothetical protein